MEIKLQDNGKTIIISSVEKIEDLADLFTKLINDINKSKPICIKYPYIFPELFKTIA